MTTYGFDAAYQPDLAAVKAAGGVAVNGYLTGRYATTTSSPAHALAAGLGWWATYEENPAELVNATRATGQNAGRKILTAFRELRDNDGKPLPLDGSLAVYPSVDQSVLDPTACDQAWMGLRDILAGKLSVRYYGQGSIGDHLHRQGLLDGPYWLAAPTSWPGYNPADPAVCIVQEVGTNVPGTDRNHILTQPAAIGAVWPTGSPYTQGEDMPTLEEIVAAVHKDVASMLADPYHAYLPPVEHKLDALAAAVAGVAAQVAAMQAANSGMTPDQVTAAAKAGAEAALAGYALTLTPPAAGSDLSKGVQ